MQLLHMSYQPLVFSGSSIGAVQLSALEPNVKSPSLPSFNCKNRLQETSLLGGSVGSWRLRGSLTACLVKRLIMVTLFNSFLYQLSLWVRPCQPNYKPEIKIKIKIQTEASKGGVVDHPSAIACTGHGVLELFLAAISVMSFRCARPLSVTGYTKPNLPKVLR